jgi:hypothetical protein
LNKMPWTKNSSVQALLGEGIAICLCGSAGSIRSLSLPRQFWACKVTPEQYNFSHSEMERRFLMRLLAPLCWIGRLFGRSFHNRHNWVGDECRRCGARRRHMTVEYR